MARIPASGAEQHERFQKKLLVQSFSRRGKQAMETSLKGEEDGEEDEGPTTLDTKETPLEKQVIALKKKVRLFACIVTHMTQLIKHRPHYHNFFFIGRSRYL